MSEANDLVRLVEDSMKEADMHTAVGLYGYVSWEEVLEKRAAEWLARERARWQAEAWERGWDAAVDAGERCDAAGGDFTCGQCAICNPPNPYEEEADHD